ncbi:MAG: portal protein, partial [Planctomycetota bacterium]
MSEVKKLAMVRDFWKRSDEGLRDEFARMHEGFRFYTGDQWSAADMEKLQQEKRPALTINLVLPIINLLSGIQRQGRQDITVVARKGGYGKLASVY